MSTQRAKFDGSACAPAFSHHTTSRVLTRLARGSANPCAALPRSIRVPVLRWILRLWLCHSREVEATALPPTSTAPLLVAILILRYLFFLALLLQPLHLLDVRDDGVERFSNMVHDLDAIPLAAVLPYSLHERGINLFQLLQ